ncbi:MAG: Gldg family protein [Planctomycetaceae bacterium]|nr:Gldg family protein [Planctomycetaceae bacterium]
MRFHVISAVFNRNVASYFSGVLGYLFIIVFVVAGAFLAFNEQFFTDNLCTLDQLSTHFPLLLLFIVPAITMTTWADERKVGTDELLFTLPATDVEILIGKYLAVLAVYTVALGFSLSHAVVLQWLGSPDPWLLLSTYFGYWFAGAALLAAGMFASVLTNSATVAFVLGSVICAIPVFIEQVPGLFRGLLPGFLVNLIPGLDSSLSGLARQGDLFSVGGRLGEFTRGEISLGGIFYFVGLTLFFLYLNAVMIARRHWAGGKNAASMTGQFALRTVCLGIAILCGAYVVSSTGFSFDSTAEGLHTLSSTTTELLKTVPDEKPVTIQAFVSREVPAEYVRIRKELVDRLNAFDRIGGKNVQVRIVDVEPYSPAAEEADGLGIEPQQVQTEEDGRVSVTDVYSGLVISSGFDTVTVPSFSPGTPIEYELTRSLGTVTQSQRRKVGILNTDVQPIGGFDMQSFQSRPEWQLVQELRKQYDVEQVGLDSAYPDNLDVLIAILPSSLTPPQMEHLLDYVGSGKPVLIFDDPAPYFTGPGMAPLSPKPSQGGGMMGMQQPGEPKADGGRATSLTELLGIRWNVEQSLFDQSNPHPRFRDLWPSEFVFLTQEDPSSTERESCLDQENVITSGLQELVTFYPGEIKSLGDVDFTPLLTTRQRSTGVSLWEEITQEMPFFGRQYRPNPRYKLDDKRHVIAALIEGKDGGGSTEGEASSGAKGVKAIFVADMDMVHDIMFRLWREQFMDLKIDNVLFVLNCVDYLAGDERYIDLRKRRAEHRSLTRIERQTSQFDRRRSEEVRKAEEAAEKTLDEAKARLEAKIAELTKELEQGNVDAGTMQVRITTATEAENRKLAQQEKEITREKNEQIRNVRMETQQEVRAIENNAWKIAVGLSPLPAIILGMIVLFLKLMNERQGIASDRLR